MLESLLSSILIAQTDYVHLTPVNKAAIERKVSVVQGMADPQLSAGEISGILGLTPECTTSQIQEKCVWTERSRTITAYWSLSGKFQRWEPKGF